MPIRIYYRLMRWIFGNDYDPFKTDMKEGLHPIPTFLKKYHLIIRIIYYAPMYILPTLFIPFILRFIQKIFNNSSYTNMKKVD